MSISENAKCELTDLPQIKDRMTFLYLERCKLTCKSSGLCVLSSEQKGHVYIPISTFMVLMLGPGVDISSDAIHLCGDVGITILWVGEHGVRFYAHGRPLTQSSRYLDAQVVHYTKPQLRMEIARKMFSYRFPEEDVMKLNIRELRLKEASRVKQLYKDCAAAHGIVFRRDYNVDDFQAGDDVNQALSAGNVCLYGICHAVIMALGMSPALGFVHRGHSLSFVYDMADLYKHRMTIPLAFELGSQHVPDIGNVVRRECRQIFYETKLLKTIVNDMQMLFGLSQTDVIVTSDLELWGDT